jgi:hypothetical protein
MANENESQKKSPEITDSLKIAIKQSALLIASKMTIKPENQDENGLKSWAKTIIIHSTAIEESLYIYYIADLVLPNYRIY